MNKNAINQVYIYYSVEILRTISKAYVWHQGLLYGLAFVSIQKLLYLSTLESGFALGIIHIL